jgi:hypothetical protein
LSSRNRNLLGALVLGVIGSTTTLPATAAGVDPAQATAVQREQAQARFLRGKQSFDARAFDAALTEFQASYDIVASPNSRLYIGRTLVQLGRNVEAFAELGRTEIEAREQAAADNRYVKTAEAAAEERANLRRTLGWVSIRIDNAPEGTKLFAGAEEIRRGGWSEPIPVKSGTTEIRIESPGRPPIVKTVTVDAGQSTALTIDAAAGAPSATATPAATTPTPPPAVTPPPSSQPEQKSSLRPYAYVAGGVGVAGLATFTIFGLMASSTHSDLESRCPDGRCTTDPADDVSHGKTQQTVANIGLIVGVVALGAGVALFLLEPKSHHTAASTRRFIGVGKTGVLGGTF